MNKRHISENTKNITVNVPDWLYEAVIALATKNKMKMGAYLRQVMIDAKNKQVQFKTIPHVPEFMAPIMEQFNSTAPPPGNDRAGEKPARIVVPPATSVLNEGNPPPDLPPAKLTSYKKKRK